MADGFVCYSDAQHLKIHAYNEVQLELGTRNPAVMVLSDTAVNVGRKTIAKFDSANSVLNNDGALYTAKVDLRFNDSERKGENLAGTKLGEVKTILLDVAFSYADPVSAGTELPGTMTIIKRNGEQWSFDVDCTRYLKGE